MGINELYTGLQTHLIDGGEMSLAPTLTRKIYEVVKYLSITNHLSAGIMMLANGGAWRQLPSNLRDLATRHFDAAAVADREEMVRDETSTEQALAAKGMVVNHSDVGTFKAAVRKAGLYAQWRDTFGADAWSTLEKSVGPLA